MISIGIDPGLAKFHLCITIFDEWIAGPDIVPYDTIKKFIDSVSYCILDLNSTRMYKTINQEDVDIYRFLMIEATLIKVLQEIQPDIVAIEEPSYSKMDGKQGERGYVYYRCLQNIIKMGVPIIPVNIQTLKSYALGQFKRTDTDKHGEKKNRDSKIDMIEKAQEDFSFVKNDDQADSLFLSCYGVTYIDRARKPVLDLKKAATLYTKCIKFSKEM